MSSAANEATQQIIAAFGRRRPGWRVDLQQAAWSDPTAGLASGDVDTALLRLPFPGQDDVRIEVLLTVPRWVALAMSGVLAGFGASLGALRSQAGTPAKTRDTTTAAAILRVISSRPISHSRLDFSESADSAL